MCLITKRNIPNVAENDITVYKFVRYYDKKQTSSIRLSIKESFTKSEEKLFHRKARTNHFKTVRISKLFLVSMAIR